MKVTSEDMRRWVLSILKNSLEGISLLQPFLIILDELLLIVHFPVYPIVPLCYLLPLFEMVILVCSRLSISLNELN